MFKCILFLFIYLSQLKSEERAQIAEAQEEYSIIQS